MSEQAGAPPRSPPSTGWLIKHGFSVVVGSGGLLTAACYAIGRAELIGWYNEAGIPELTFVWAFQDSVLNGFLSVEAWARFLGLALPVSMYFALPFVVGELFKPMAKRRLELKERGESFDRLGLRKRFASAARNARRSNVHAEAATARWRLLGKRGVFRRQKLSGTVSPMTRALAVAATGVLMFVMLGMVYVVGAYTLVIKQYENGKLRFRMEYLAATGHLPPPRQVGPGARSVRADKASDMPTTAQIKQSEIALRDYRLVQLFSLGDDVARRPLDCGWLIQNSGSKVLILGSTGLHMRDFGDHGFAWDFINEPTCPNPS